ncbi:DUF1612 domain-containing protein [Phenylobacterium sp. VNQ135]|uniref:DUF1612 domain-containing protein n=1 Tax=Phenylobacterium sp. VNQ135 TaxID=3400922 RepID=UPI003C02D3A8
MNDRDRGLPDYVIALAKAEDAVSRLDELAATPLGRGALERLAFQEAAAWSWNAGALVHLEDLVLHEHGLDVRTPDTALTRAHGVLRFWREAQGRPHRDVLTVTTLAKLLGDRRVTRGAAAELRPPPRRGLASDGPSQSDPLIALMLDAESVTTEDDGEALAAWFALEERAPRAWPALLRAAILREAWQTIDPLPRRGFVGNVLIDAVLRRERRIRRHALLVEIGQRELVASGFRRSGLRDRAARLTWQLEAMAAGAEAGRREYERLSLARDIALQRAKGRRSDSRLPALIDLLCSRPIVTAAMAAQRLGITESAARSLIGTLGSSVVEVTGRRRFRAWRL